MKLFLSLLVLVSAALAAPEYNPIFNYHERIGIPKATLIKAAEEASDFDGSRIIGGSAARLGQFPFMGGLIIDLGSRNSFCGSSLLTNTRLVTAAHCWFDGGATARQFTVVLGSVRLFHGGHRVVTRQVAMHPQWNTQTLANDIAVITIPWVGYSANIRNVGLASGSNTFAGQTATAAGFGMTGPGQGITNNQVLSFVPLPVVTNARCMEFFSSRFVIASTLCTWGATGRNICSSDSGGPLVLSNTLIGVVSFGAAVCGQNAPAGYARVTSFNSWIRSRL